jgi:UDP-2,4-diacetamido-2,4,6-trideoxy-beta-L-altropyranose hydrolase
LVKKIAFRVDASIHIGFGHVMRCLTLAQALLKAKSNIIFICRPQQGDLISLITLKGFTVHKLDPISDQDGDSTFLKTTQLQDARDCEELLKIFLPDLLIVDHYCIDFQWQEILKGTYKKLMIIDDLGDRKHHADFLLDQNFGTNDQKYKFLVPKHCKQLLGSDFALLREEFLHFRKKSLARRRKFKLKKILISMGGIDLENYTFKILSLIQDCSSLSGIEIIVAISSKYPHIKQLVKLSNNKKISLKVDSGNIAKLMFQADLAIGASGAATWERCCLGLPSIQLIVAENQQSLAHALAHANAIKLIYDLNDLPDLLKNPEAWAEELTQNSQCIVDGQGASRVINTLLYD